MSIAQIDQALRDFVLQDTAHLRRGARADPVAQVGLPPSVADAIPVEITETVTIVVPGQSSEDEEVRRYRLPVSLGSSRAYMIRNS
jgi:hypothetical protein